MTKKVILVTGAARSGKSEWAEYLAKNTQKSIVYVATATISPKDREWQERILKHQQRRPQDWITIAEPENLVGVIQQGTAEQCLLIDSLGTWVANLLAVDHLLWQSTIEELLSAVAQTEAELIFVGEETGWGVVPAYESGRLFRDRLGRILRQVGMMADSSYLVVGGHAVDLRILGTSLHKIN